MLYNSSVASKVLFAGTDNFLFVEVFSNSLHCSQCLSSVALLDPDMDQPVLDHNLLLNIKQVDADTKINVYESVRVRFIFMRIKTL